MAINPFDDLTTELDELDLQTGSQASSPLASDEDVDDGPRPADPVRESGEPLEVVAQCPKGVAVNYSLSWYYLPYESDDTVDYLICTRCHADHIKGTALEPQFKKIEWPNGGLAVCGFWLPRIKNVLWPEAVRTNSVNALRAYMTKRLQIKQCPGQTATDDVEGRVLYGMMDNSIQGFVACEACYQEYVVGTSFESKFGTYLESSSSFSCHLSIPYIAGAVAPTAKHSNWSGFVTAAIRRLELSACKGDQIRTDGCEWYLLENEAISDFQVCETCYLDKLALTPFKQEFQRLNDDFDPETWTCGLADRNWSTLLALKSAKQRSDFQVFVDAAQVIHSLVPCTSDGIIHGNWWTLMGGCEKFNICEACFTGFFQARGLDQFLQPSDRDSSSAYLCDLCPSAPRFSQYICKFLEMLDRGVFSYFSEFVMTFAGVPSCPKIKEQYKAKWWGYPEVQFCEECYLDFVAHTPLAETLTMRGEYDEGERLCQIWSPRLRKLWLDACNAGDPGSEVSDAVLEEFKSFCLQRTRVYVDTILWIEEIRAKQSVRQQTAFSRAMLSLQYSGIDSITSILGTTDGHRYGNSSLGWSYTSYGVQAKQYWNEFMTGLTDANRPEDSARIAQLESLWKQWE
ncbi:hypothetical protein V8C35DRAFT_292774 [Trichoderma chlorosporum]